jgi:hypothetical protein
VSFLRETMKHKAKVCRFCVRAVPQAPEDPNDSIVPPLDMKIPKRHAADPKSPSIRPREGSASNAKLRAPVRFPRRHSQVRPDGRIQRLEPDGIRLAEGCFKLAGSSD